MLEVDVKDFSGRKAVDYPKIAEAIPRILEAAFERCGLTWLWEQQQARETSGDGYAAVFPTAFLPHLLNPFLGALQDELDYREQVDAKPAGLRMRVSVTTGPITDAGPNATGTGTARIELNRLLNCDPVRDLLSRSGPLTKVAAAVSPRAYEDAVMSGYSGETEDDYVAIPVTVKTYQDTVYLRVPRPSGDLLKNGFDPTPTASGSTAAMPAPEAGAHVYNNTVNGTTAGTVLQIGSAHGPVNAEQRRDTYNTRGDNYHHSGSGPQFNRSDVKRYDDRRGEHREP
ncbi:hypothetical protein [Actinosynnema pretiosum]|uniref:Uncharacterized protein n=2 Tax=Actinosynnema pretiosum TaxID=42197 RepID=A0A290Z7V2_9PSEU|nr:hypothetical protein [Actinosynnema pretiosum]ATE55049.1 hypothetical protein CNX65_18630 [Actinosynnema pretiosum]